MERDYQRARAILARPLTDESLRELREIHGRVRDAPPPHRRHRQQLTNRHKKRDTEEEDDKNESSSDFDPYPAVREPDFQSLIAGKREFAQTRLQPVRLEDRTARGVDAMWDESCGPREFRLTPTQIFLKHFMSPRTPYNSLLLFHGVGVGKTCSAITIAEGFPGRKALVLVNPNLQDNFRKEVFDPSNLQQRASDGQSGIDFSAVRGCTGRSYLDRVEGKELLTAEAIERRVTRLVNQKYSFMGPRQFANYVRKLGEGLNPVERVRAKFSGMLIIVDEAHHLRTHGGGPSGENLVAPALRRVLQCAEDVKLLLMTATPMFNDPRDLLELVNLMLMNDKRPRIAASEVFDSSGRLTAPGKKTLEEATRGYVSYMRGDSPFSFPLRLGPSASGDTLVMSKRDFPRLDIHGNAIQPADMIHQNIEICGSRMSAYQASVYAAFQERLSAASLRQEEEAEEAKDDDDGVSQAADDDHDGDGDDTLDGNDIDGAVGPNKRRGRSKNEQLKANKGERQRSAHVLQAGLEICNVVFPSGVPGAPRHGREALLNCMDILSTKPLRMAYRPNVPRFLAPAHLPTYAPKMHAIVQRILSARGIVFVYSRFIWMGLIPLALALEHAGFERLNERNLLHSTAADDKKSPMSRRGSYTILCGNPDITPDASRDISVVRSRGNIDGDVVKVVLASEFATEGIDLRNVREVHILDPWYHLNKVEQIVGRACRYCSHSSLPLEKRNVTVYLHAACMSPPNKTFQMTKDNKKKMITIRNNNNNTTRETLDLRAYRIASCKDAKMKDVERALMANAVDCHLTRERTYFDPDKLGTRITVVTSQGKEIKSYKLGDDPAVRRPVTCVSPIASKNHLGHTDGTYDPEVHAMGVDEAADRLRAHFAGNVRATLAELQEALTDGSREQREALMLALDRMLATKVGVTYNGRPGFLVRRADMYLYQPVDASPLATLEERSQSAQTAKAPVAQIMPPASSTTTTTSSSMLHASSSRVAKAAAADYEDGLGHVRGEKRKLHNANDDSSTRPTTAADTANNATNKKWDSKDPASSLAERVLLTAHRMPAKDTDAYAQQLLDMAVDRLKPAELLDACRLALSVKSQKGHHPKSNKTVIGADGDSNRKISPESLLESLTSAGVLFTAHDNSENDARRKTKKAYVLLDAGGGTGWYATVDGGAQWTPCKALDLQAAMAMAREQHRGLRPDIRTYAAYLAAPPGNPAASIFKIIGSSAGAEGCVCHQTSSVTVDNLIRKIKNLAPGIYDSKKKADKRSLCAMYELVLRKHLPRGVLRPAQYATVKAMAAAAKLQ
jgi:Helicase conserved C-terminal domain/Type III restriction enzyme, res subunit